MKVRVCIIDFGDVVGVYSESQYDRIVQEARATIAEDVDEYTLDECFSLECESELGVLRLLFGENVTTRFQEIPCEPIQVQLDLLETVEERVPV